MAIVTQREVNEISFVGPELESAISISTESFGIAELEDSELEISGGGGHQANSHFNRHRSQTKATSFAGPEGAGSTFNHQEETVSSGNSDFSWD